VAKAKVNLSLKAVRLYSLLSVSYIFGLLVTTMITDPYCQCKFY